MKDRSLALFLLVYLSLDLGNPFMPGAVTFVDGGLQVIDAGRPAALSLPMPAVAGHLVSGRHEDPSPALLGVTAPVPRPRWVPRLVRLTAGDASPAPDDH